MNQKTPPGLGTGGRRLYRSVTADFELGDHEKSLLLEAARTVDTVDGLQKILDEEGLMMTSPQGTKAHPAAVEIRQQRIVLAKLISSLKIPVEEDEGASRIPQKRSGVRPLSAVR